MDVWPFPHKTRLLVIDDEVAFTRLFKLAADHYEIRCENDPLGAIQAAQEFRPDLILLDRLMPSVTGDKLAESIKSHPQLKDIPFAFLTASVPLGEDGSFETTLIGFPVLEKPVSIEAIDRCVKECLKR
jgi:CheY-like chemotaxis protein